MLRFKRTGVTNNPEPSDTFLPDAIKQISMHTNKTLLDFLEANKGLNTFKLMWRYELVRYKEYKNEQKHMLNALKDYDSRAWLRKNGRVYLRETRIGSFIMRFEAMHEVELIDRLRCFVRRAECSKDLCKSFHEDISKEYGNAASSKEFSTNNSVLSDAERVLGEKFEAMYGKINGNDRPPLRNADA